MACSTPPTHSQTARYALHANALQYTAVGAISRTTQDARLHSRRTGGPAPPRRIDILASARHAR